MKSLAHSSVISFPHVSVLIFRLGAPRVLSSGSTRRRCATGTRVPHHWQVVVRLVNGVLAALSAAGTTEVQHGVERVLIGRQHPVRGARWAGSDLAGSRTVAVRGYGAHERLALVGRAVPRDGCLSHEVRYLRELKAWQCPCLSVSCCAARASTGLVREAPYAPADNPDDHEDGHHEAEPMLSELNHASGSLQSQQPQ